MVAIEGEALRPVTWVVVAATKSRAELFSSNAFQPGSGFFAHERLGPAGWREEVMRGGVSMIKIDAPSLADAKIHHWVGAVFVPGLTLDRLLATLKAAAGSESRFYDDVVQSRLLEPADAAA